MSFAYFAEGTRGNTRVRLGPRLCKNQAQLQQAERLLSARWADPTLFSEKMELCQKALSVRKRMEVLRRY